MEVFTPAKLNLFLEIGGKRSDGYHEIISLATPVNLWDRMIFQFSEEPTSVRLECLDEHGNLQTSLPSDDRNLIVRAVHLLASCCNRENLPQPFIRLYKRIPQEAGLGGGSSDAAATLLAMNLYWKTGFSRHALQQMGTKLGSDVPLFLESGTVLCRGRGEIIEPVTGIPEMFFVLLKPPFGLSTKIVYDTTSKLPPYTYQNPAKLIQTLVSHAPPTEYTNLFFNRMEQAAIQLRPELKEMFSLEGLPKALSVHMSGSGSSLFFHCKDQTAACQTAQELEKRHWGHVYMVKGRSESGLNPFDSM